MANLRNCISILVVIAAVPVLAQCPEIGDYRSLDGTMMLGRAIESWCGADGNPVAPGQPGNAQVAESWDGVALGSQWRFWGMSIDNNGPMLVGSNINADGTGWRDYHTNYVGGQFWLSGDHTWSLGGEDLLGTLNSFSVNARLVYFRNELVSVASNFSMDGSFDDCENCSLEFAMGDALLAWRSDWGPAPANYPAFACDATSGEYFDVCTIRASINCFVATEGRTWGAVKSLFNN